MRETSAPRPVRTLALVAILAITAASCSASAAPSTTQTDAPSAAVATLPPAQTSAATPASTTPAATAAAASSAGTSAVIALGRKVFETSGPVGKGCQECHAKDAKGSQATDGTTAPSIRGATEVKLRNALAGGASLMTNIKLTDNEIEAVIEYLKFLDLQ